MNYQLDPDTGALLIPLGGRKYPDRFALIDADDIDIAEGYSWRPVCTNPKAPHILYVSAYTPNRRYVYLHRVLLGITERRFQVDHINRNGLDNRRENLRIVTPQQNQFNRRPQRTSLSGFKGVSWCEKDQRWRAQIVKNGEQHGLGQYRDPVKAALAYDAAARVLFGEHAYLNFPEAQP